MCFFPSAVFSTWNPQMNSRTDINYVYIKIYTIYIYIYMDTRLFAQRTSQSAGIVQISIGEMIMAHQRRSQVCFCGDPSGWHFSSGQTWSNIQCCYVLWIFKKHVEHPHIPPQMVMIIFLEYPLSTIFKHTMAIIPYPTSQQANV